MAIKTEDLEKIEETLKLEKGTLSKAIESEEETEVELPELVIKTKEEDETFTTNLRKEAKTAGVEMAIKDVRNDMGLDFQGKTMENLLDAFKTKTLSDAKADLGEPNKKIEELEGDLNKVRANLTEKEGEITGLKTQMQNEKSNTLINSNLLGLIPDNIAIDKSDALVLFKNKHDVSIGDNGQLVIKKDGVELKNTTNLEPIPAKDIMETFTNPFLKKPDGGGGGDNETGEGKAGSIEAFTKEMVDKGIAVGSEEFNKNMNKRIADKTLTV